MVVPFLEFSPRQNVTFSCLGPRESTEEHIEQEGSQNRSNYMAGPESFQVSSIALDPPDLEPPWTINGGRVCVELLPDRPAHV